MAVVDYSKQEVPITYACRDCGSTNCKLWRPIVALASDVVLRCARCIAKITGVDISDIDAFGSIPDRVNGIVMEGIRTDQLGGYLPAIPTENGTSYWQYSFVPPAGAGWWRDLPSVSL